MVQFSVKLEGNGLSVLVKERSSTIDRFRLAVDWLSCCAITVVASKEKLFVSIVIVPWITKPRAAQINDVSLLNETFLSLHVEIFLT